MSKDKKLLKEAKKLPWEDRLTHKNWKVRNDANIDLAAVCDAITDPKDPRLREFGPFFRKTVANSNAAVQEKALDALIAFLEAADTDAGRYAKEVCDTIVAKCLTGRPKTAQIALMLWVELEAVEAFLDAMEKAIKNRVAKAVVPAIDVMFQALSEFGSKIIPPERILKMLPELFDRQDQNVRASSKGLTLELSRWIGKDPVKLVLFEKMQDTMKKELEAELANVIGTAKPTRKIRKSYDKQFSKEEIDELLAFKFVVKSRYNAERRRYMKKYIKNLKQCIRSLVAEEKEARFAAERTQQDNASANDKIPMLEKMCKLLEDHIASLNEQVAQWKASQDELIGQREVLGNEIACLLSELQNVRDDHDRQVEALTSEVRKYKSTCLVQSEQIRELQEQLKQAEKKLQPWKQDMELRSARR